ncbi:hypothetical protein BDQ12DRAFT_628860 [Crucibulum laeve]|uniref:C2H2-type domain-containing protein n=1 Tax=Crucibulum laeve TaxID=68775 RepID=A0A5C3M555_9AGAR|nr:hypothetical protein BDQ12DRAFT_628860 [Crucibulum laeve]
MLPQLLPHPPHIKIPKYSADYSSHIPPHPKQHLSPSFFSVPPHFVPATVSPIHSDSPSDSLDDDPIPSPQSPPTSSANYHYANCDRSFTSPTEMYDNNASATYSTSSFPSASDPQAGFHITDAVKQPSEVVAPYLSESPSPVDAHRSSPFPHPFSAPHSQERFPHAGAPPYLGEDRLDHPDSHSESYSRQAPQDKYPSAIPPHNSLLDQRRMSEPAILGSANLYAPHATDATANSRYEQFNFAFNPPAPPLSRSPTSYAPALQRGSSIGSLRDLRQLHYQYSSPNSQHVDWKQEDNLRHRHHTGSYGSAVIDEPISPLQPNFSGGLVGSSSSGLPYSPGADNYGPSPPNTGTSTSSMGFICSPAEPHHIRNSTHDSSSIDVANSKTYSFVALPGNTVKKRPRRRYDEIERLYQCSWPDCTKAYGTLNHLNAHVTMQKHGSKRSPNEFKELRKQWRKARKIESPGGGPIRRDSIPDDSSLYDAPRYAPQHHSLPLSRQMSGHSASGLPLSVSIPQHGSNERYSISVDDIRYPIHERDDHEVDYGHVSARQRFNTGNMPSSWHPGSSLPSRTNLHESYTSSTHEHQAQHPSAARRPSPSSTLPMNRLPSNSTLFTPLPGYQAPSMLPTLQSGGDISYTEGYELYEDDGSRPGTGHASIGRGSGEEY